jgi:lysine 2,3-aminomutase
LYCFRQDLLSENKTQRELSLDDKLAVLVTHLKAHPATSEVILSGGDPLMLPLTSLEKIYAALSEIKTVRDIRIHTRAPVFAPSLLDDARKIALFASAKTRFVFHIVHPYEVCDEVAVGITRLKEAGIALYNHFPLLRQVNDHADVLVALIRRLENLGVHTFSVYVPEPVPYSAVYRLPFRRAARLMDEVKARVPGWADFRFCLDTPIGKVGCEHLIAADESSHTLAFMFEGKRVRYPDFPEYMDEAGEPATLLWKGA